MHIYFLCKYDVNPNEHFYTPNASPFFTFFVVDVQNLFCTYRILFLNEKNRKSWKGYSIERHCKRISKDITIGIPHSNGSRMFESRVVRSDTYTIIWGPLRTNVLYKHTKIYTVKRSLISGNVSIYM